MKTINSMLLIIILFTIVSCKSRYEYQYFEYVERINCSICDFDEIMQIVRDTNYVHKTESITLLNDSTIRYYKRYGGLSIYRYKLNNNVITIDTIDINGFRLPKSYRYFSYNKDSLVNMQTDEIYFSEKYIKKHWPKPKKISSRKIQKIMKKMKKNENR